MLPYANLQEAETALGRELSGAEKLWFKYSAKQPDFLLYYHNLPLFFLFYTLAPLPYILVHLLCSKKTQIYKLQPKNYTFSDMLTCYTRVIRTYLLTVGFLQVFSYPVVKWVGIRTNLELPSGWEMSCQILVYFLIEDYSNYWIHRLLHCEWAYDKIHRMHHEFSSPMALAAPYAHWAEILLLGLPSFLGPAIVPGHILTFWLWFVLRQIESIETHSGYEFPWSPAKFIPFYGGAEYHDYHHYVGAQCGNNFASVFTYCDYIYGTDKGYRYQKAIFKKAKEKL
ncbi:methylsterol monooxygenase 1-1-like [Carica papaya]|uniref:methylsterol monooxygenase 1-1-like n=1 Tax=Carica papaya TaxID=3649 RepID=UPI000B8D00D4|nr:methylsterol monooxygenase 1-1-like [Carica papaya]